jgi:hypothetical protein
VKIVGEYPGSTSEVTYTCFDCSAGLGLDSRGIPQILRPRDFLGPGVIFTLNGAATTLTIECRAQKCTTRPETGVAREFSSGNSVTVPIKAGIHFTFSRR